MNAASLRLAILGCGAVTEQAYLPAVARSPNIGITLLIDTNADRRARLAAQFGVEHTAASVDGAYDLFDAAVVALPHALHAPACIQLLAHGKPVLVEKPMANSVAECDAMINAAEQSGVVLAVGLMRRFFLSHQLARRAVEQGALGKIQSFDIREGGIYNWPVASDFFFRKEAAGGGVLIDTGAHTLDALLYWLGDFADVEYFDDARGGVEADCLINLRMQSGVCGTVELSRTRQLRNTAILRGERGELEIGLWNRAKFSLPDAPYALEGVVGDRNESDKIQDYLGLIVEQVEDFADSIKNRRSPMADGRSARTSIQLIETCYRQRKPLTLPWANPDLSSVEIL